MDSICITTDVLDVAHLKKQLPLHPCCGALVCFEGIVRNHHSGQKVLGITYECFESMAKKELEKIFQEVWATYPIHYIKLVHRIGRLNVGEVSLVLFVLSPHRREGFEAAQYMINELKHRAPIWKKEFYENGHSEWVGCEPQAHSGHPGRG